MKLKLPLLIVVFLLVTSIGVYVFTNLSRAEGKLEFSNSEDKNMNALKITGPYGWYCVTYSKEKFSEDGPLKLAGLGYSVFPLVGATELRTNYYPNKGSLAHIPLDQPTLFHRNGAIAEYYILITKDKSKYEALKEELNGKLAN